jgi:large subunit ribosomal protein L1
MGSKKIKVVNTAEEAEKTKKQKKATEKEVVKQAEAEAKEAADAKAMAAGEVKAKKNKKAKLRSKRYKALKLKVDRNKLYSPSEAVPLTLEMATTKIDESIEIHLNTRTAGLTGSVNLPFGTGKKQKVAIATEALIEQISKGKIDFDILIAEPKMMPKIARVARILGPKGLMPNPKNETISANPEELKKKLEGGETRFKCEPKAALMHMVIGKASFGKEKILANLEAFIKAVKPGNIGKAYLKSTHSPSLKLDITYL